MVKMKTCCFCMDLRVGSYLSAGYTLLLGLLLVALLSLGVQIVDNNDDISSVYDKKEFYVYVALGLYIAWVISSILLIVGINTRRKGFCIPWLVVTMILTGLMALGFVLIWFEAGGVDVESNIIIGVSIVGVSIIILNIYAVVCVGFFSKQINKTTRDDETELARNAEEPDGRPAYPAMPYAISSGPANVNMEGPIEQKGDMSFYHSPPAYTYA